MDELERCPFCGGGVLCRGKASRIGTPKVIKLMRLILPHGVTCVECGYYKPSVKSWNKEGEKYNGK